MDCSSMEDERKMGKSVEYGEYLVELFHMADAGR